MGKLNGLLVSAFVLLFVLGGTSPAAVVKPDRGFGGSGLVTTGFGAEADLDSEYAGGLATIQGESPSGELTVLGRGGSSFQSAALFRFDTYGRLVPGSLHHWFARNSNQREFFGLPGGGYLIAAENTISRFGPSGRAVSAFGNNGSIVLRGGTVDRIKLGLNGEFFAAIESEEGVSIARFSAEGDKLSSRFFGGWSDGAIVDVSASGEALFVLDLFEEVEFEGPVLLSRRSFAVLDSDGGKLSSPVFPLEDQQNFIRFRAGGGYLIAGNGQPLSALKPDGSVDPTFGEGGVAWCSDVPPANTFSNIYSLDTDSQGRIITFDVTGDGTCGLTRFLPNGEVDDSFMAEGLPKYSHEIDQIAIDRSDRLILTKWEEDVGGPVLRRYTESGQLDPSFGTDGAAAVPVPIPTDDEVSDSLVQPDGKLVVAGWTRVPYSPQSDFALARYMPNGGLDRQFGEKGRVKLDLGLGDRIESIAFQENGRIVAAGRTAGRAVILRFTRSGKLDRSFGNKGWNVAEIGDETSRYSDVVVRPDGKISAIGTASAGNYHTDWLIGQVKSNGREDTGFAGGGLLRLDVGGSKGSVFGDDPGDYDEGAEIAVDRRNRLALAGVSAYPSQNPEIVIYRLRPNGKLLGSFGRKGRTRFSLKVVHNPSDPYTTELDVVPSELKLRPGGSMALVAGRQYGGYGTGLKTRNLGALVSIRANGKLDRRFGSGSGFVRKEELDFKDLAIDPCGRFVVGGSLAYGKASSERPGMDDFGLARFKHNGRLDRTFAGGIVRSRTGPDRQSTGASLATTRGRIYLSGSTPTARFARDFATVGLGVPKKPNCG